MGAKSTQRTEKTKQSETAQTVLWFWIHLWQSCTRKRGSRVQQDLDKQYRKGCVGSDRIALSKTTRIRNADVEKCQGFQNRRIPFLYARESQVFSGFWVIGSLPGKANVRYFLSERSLSKRGLNLMQRCNKKTQRCIHRILGNTEILQGSDVEKCWSFTKAYTLRKPKIYRNGDAKKC